MAKKASAKGESGGRKPRKKSSSSGSRAVVRASSGGSRGSDSGGNQADFVDALIKLLQSPLVIDLLAVGATAALAAITETRSGRAQGVVGSSKKTLKAAGKAAASAVGRRLATEFDEIKAASQRASGQRKTKAGAKA